MTESQDPLIPAAQVRERFGGVSDMWIHRRLHDDSGFPRPLYIGRLRFWRLSELTGWEQSLPKQNPGNKCRDRLQATADAGDKAA